MKPQPLKRGRATQLALFYLSFVLFFRLSVWAQAIPPMSAPVVDLADMISSDVEARLNQALAQLYRSGGSQIGVLTVPDLGGVPIETYSIKVVDQWKLGTAKNDNGVLLLISRDDRELRIEVGQGLEGDLTDLHSKRIIDYSITPLFKQQDFDGGIVMGVAQITARTDPQFDLRPFFGSETFQARPASSRGGGQWLFIILILLFLFLRAVAGLFGLGRRRSRWSRTGALMGGLAGWSAGRQSRGYRGGLGGGGFGGGWGGGGGGFSGGGASGRW